MVIQPSPPNELLIDFTVRYKLNWYLGGRVHSQMPSMVYSKNGRLRRMISKCGFNLTRNQPRNFFFRRGVLRCPVMVIARRRKSHPVALHLVPSPTNDLLHIKKRWGFLTSPEYHMFFYISEAGFAVPFVGKCQELNKPSGGHALGPIPDQQSSINEEAVRFFTSPETNHTF